MIYTIVLGKLMIPYALLSCLLNDEEVRIVDLSVFHIVVRCSNEIERIDSLFINIYIESKYETIEIEHFEIIDAKNYKYYHEYRIDIKQKEYTKLMSNFLGEYQRYIKLKNEDRQELFTNYPVQLDSIYPKTYDSFLSNLFDVKVDQKYKEIIKDVSLGICLEEDRMYQQFLDLCWSEFKEKYFQNVYLCNHPISKIEVKYIYIGNQFCSNLYPSISVLKEILKKSLDLHLQVVFQFSTIKQHEIKKVKEILNVLKEYSNIEIVVNDFGMFELLKDEQFSLSLGVLLNKHVKDTRLQYKKGKKQIRESSINTSFYQTFLKKYNIKRFSYESCQYHMEMVQPVDLYFPRFQMNTSGYCTMYAKCHNNNRALQEEVKECKKYCLYNTFLYPTHLQMVGKYNSLFGYDTRILYDSTYLEQYVSQVDRMIINV